MSVVATLPRKIKETHLHTSNPSPYHKGDGGRVAETRKMLLKRNAKMNILKEVEKLLWSSKVMLW